MRNQYLFIVCLLFAITGINTLTFAQGNLIFSDEFNGSSLDQTKWSYETGNGCPGLCGWGNNEKEFYTNSTQNVNVSGGYLNITARYSPNHNGSGSDFTSGKINTRGKFDRLYGRFEARMRLPRGRGIWPAFWMLPTNNEYGNWPTSGEIDIMEYRGYEINKSDATLHYGSAWPNNQWDGNSYTLPSGNFADEFHVFAVEWQPGIMRFYVDNVLIKTETENPNSLSPQSNHAVKWPWNRQFYMIINLAIGGNYIGSPSTDAILAGGTFPQTMQVDYVRVYDMSSTCSIPHAPYQGVVRTIPGKIEAEHYNNGCNGVAYNDADAINNGGQLRTDAVDIEASTDTGGGHNIGWTAPGEWLNYNVNVPTAGTYNVQLRVATTATGKRMRVEMNGTSITGSVTLPNTGGWQTWQTVTINNVSLTAGTKTMRVFFETDGINLNFVNFVSLNQPPSVSLTAPANNATYTAPASITITASASDSDGSISRVEFFSGSTKLGERTASPYTYNWTGVGAGTYTVTARATDNLGAVTTSVGVTVIVNASTPTQSPYGGSAWAIPGRIEAENYDLGGQGIAFNDVTPANEGGAYRADAVDIEACTDTGGGHNVGWIQADEWLEYTVNVTTAGTYRLDARVAAISAGRTFRVEMAGTTIANFTVPNTGGWQTWQTVTANGISLTAGQRIMRIYATGSDFNLNYVAFTSASTPTNQAPTVALTAPVNNASYTAPASITITASASDVDGTVTRVEFFNGATKLGERTATPYSYTWTNVAAGSYTITARATDNNGATTTSASRLVTVNPANTNTCSGIAQYVENGGYNPGSRVQNVGSRYECKPFPYSGWCNGSAWAYAPGTGAYWTDAWTLLGSCNARFAETSSQNALVESAVLTNMPNPFVSYTDVELTLAEEGEVSLALYNKGGQLVQQLVNAYLTAGTHRFVVDGNNLPADVYLIKCNTVQGSFVRKIVKTE